MKKLSEIVLLGAGNRCKVLLELISQSKFPFEVHLIDTNSSKWGKELNGYVVEELKTLTRYRDAYYCITPASFVALETIRKDVIERYGLDEKKEITYQGLIMKIYENIFIPIYVSDNKNKPLSIIFDCEYGLGLGGIEEWTKGICNEFIKHNEFMSYILCNDDQYTVPDYLRNNILKVDVDRNKSFSTDNVKKIIDCIITHLPCIIVTSQPNDVLLSGKIIKKMFGDQVKIVSGIRGGHPEINKRYLAMRDCTDLYVCVNSTIRENMIKLGVDPSKIFTMLCPIECPDKNDRLYSLDKDKPIQIGYAGRIQVDEKRVDLILKMCRELEKHNINYKFELAGEGDFENSVYQFIIDNNCQNKISIIGKIDKAEIPDFWRSKDICINLSDHEGRSRTTIEAMANGAVPIVTETSGVHDDIHNNENGFIVNLQDYESMAERIMFLEANRHLLPIMGEKAHVELKKKSSMEDHYKFWKMIISKLIL